MTPGPSSNRLLLNCDMGESFGPWTMGRDAEVMPWVDLANIACGFHASDPVTMTRTVLLARRADVRVGAHPGYPDLQGFGRRSMQCSTLEIVAMVHYQLGALAAVAQVHGLRLSHVKPHGALYNDMTRHESVLRAVLEAVATYDASLPLMVPATSDNRAVGEIADEFGVRLWFEAFADRAYDEQGFLVPRSMPGAVHRDPEAIVAQAVSLATSGTVRTLHGKTLTLNATTLCVHGDNDESVQAVRRIREALDGWYGADL